jgi:hypothetical protein
MAAPVESGLCPDESDEKPDISGHRPDATPLASGAATPRKFRHFDDTLMATIGPWRCHFANDFASNGPEKKRDFFAFNLL